MSVFGSHVTDVSADRQTSSITVNRNGFHELTHSEHTGALG